MEARGQNRTSHRDENELAWYRAELSGLDPGMNVQERAVNEIDDRSSLTVAAEPVLDKMVDDLADTRFSILLADRSSTIVDRRVGDHTVARALDRVLAVPGFQYLEEISGTNSLATAFELRKPIAVTGDEHFLDALKVFACYGAPIIHPITHRVEGVIDVSGPVSDATALLGPFLMRATRDIEERLLEGAQVAEKLLLSEFQSYSRQRSHAIVALGENLVLTNTAAVDLVKGVDHISLRAIAADMTTFGTYEGAHVLASGQAVSIKARSVPGSNGGALFDITRNRDPRPRRKTSAFSNMPAPPDASARHPQSRVLLITGEPGTGRTTSALTVAGEPNTVIDCSRTTTVPEELISSMRSALLNPDRPVVLDNLESLDARSAGMVSSAIRDSPNRVVITSTPVGELGDAHKALASLAMTRRELQPLRATPHKFAATVQSVLAGLSLDSAIDIAPSTVQKLVQHDWPGNIRELREVLTFAARGRERGTISDHDLPESIRTQAVRGRSLSLMESAERDAIVAALKSSAGNKAATAAALGISRTTLYARLRRYKIS